MEACGGTYELSNSTILALRLSLLIGTNRSLRLGSKPQTLLPITCLVSRADSVISDVQAASVSTLPPVVAAWNTSATLSFYSDIQCPADPDVRLFPRSRTVVGFSFKASQFDRARPINGRIQIFVGCETRLCAPFETNSDCVQFCRRLRPLKRLNSAA
ncbi:unnamed protein product [Dibothriocephalus latus]|uniref:ZP domain-containing protein n=1 Tax=Dibothriocephalus latus TaxID=60516 RepID=A0A3P7MX28_DIBLA|nr:unnamed protein product [Dibothriocephalus latus]